MHGLRTPREEIAFTEWPKIHSHSQIFRYGQSIFCLPYRPKFSDNFDLCLHWVSVVRVWMYLKPLLISSCLFNLAFSFKFYITSCTLVLVQLLGIISYIRKDFFDIFALIIITIECLFRKIMKVQLWVWWLFSSHFLITFCFRFLIQTASSQFLLDQWSLQTTDWKWKLWFCLHQQFLF